MSRGDTRRALGEVRRALGALLALRWVRVVGVLALLALGLRLTLVMLLARAIDGIASPYGVRCHWQELGLSLLAGRGELRGLSFTGLRTGEREPFLELEYAVFDLQLLPLFTGTLRVRRAEVDGLELHATRDAEGRWNLERDLDLAALLELFGGESEEEEAEEPAGPIDLSLPVEVDALRFQNARLRVRDHRGGDPGSEPWRDLTLELNVALSDWNTSDEPARLSVAVTGGDVLDGASVEAELVGDADRIGLMLQGSVGGLRLGALAPYLAELGLAPAAETIDLAGALGAKVEVRGEARDRLAGNLNLAALELTADGAEALALDVLRLELPELSAERLELGVVQVVGPRAGVELGAAGDLRVAGLALGAGLRAAPRVPAPEAERARAAGSDALHDPAAVAHEGEHEDGDDPFALLRPGGLPPALALFAHADGEAFPWTLAGIEVLDGELRLLDHGTEPAARQVLTVERATLGALQHVPGLERGPIPFHADLRAPANAETITLTGGFAPFAPARTLDLELAVEGIALEAVEPYLLRAGLGRALERGSLRLRVEGEATSDAEGRTSGGLRLTEMTLGDAGELFGVRGVELNELSVDPLARRVRLGELLVTGPRLNLERDPANRFLGFGLKLMGSGAVRGGARSAEENASAASRPGLADASGARPASSAPRRALPRLEVGRLAWTDSEIAFVDRASDPPRRLALYELGFELTDLVLGGTAGDPVPEPASFHARLAAEGIAGQVRVEGELLSRPGPIDLEATLAVRGEELESVALSPYLAELGIEPVLANGELRLDADVRWRESHAEPGAWEAALTLANGALVDGERTWLALERLAVERLVSDGAGLTVGRVHVVAPRARVERDAEGSLHVAGVRLLPPSTEFGGGEAGVAAEEAPAPVLALPALPALRLEALELEGFAVELEDALLADGLATTLALDASARELDTRGGEGAFALELRVPGSLEALAVDGTLRVAPERVEASAQLRGRGLTGDTLAALLPPGVTLDAARGELAGTLAAGVRDAEGGGLAAELSLTDLRWGEPGMAPWFGLERAAAAVRRFDPAAGRVELGELRVAGAELAVERDARGHLRALGFVVAPEESASGNDAGRAVPGDEARPPGTSDAGAAAEVVVPRRAPPRVELLEGLVLERARLSARDALAAPEAAPWQATLGFELDPGVLLDPEPTELPPLRWRASGEVTDTVRGWELRGSYGPFAEEPELALAFDADGLRPGGVLERLPALAEVLEAEMEAGRFGGELRARLSVRRSRPWELGFGRPFTGELELLGLALSDGDEVLLGLERLGVEAKRIDARRGLFHLESIELETPRLRARRDADGVHALGLRLDPERLAAATSAAEPESSPPTEPAPSGDPASGAPVPDLRVDRFTFAGLDVAVDDTSVDPPLALRLAELDAEVRRIALARPDRSVPFDLLLAPAAGAAGEGTAPLFDEVVLSGRIAFDDGSGGGPKGRARLQLAGLELARFAGYVAEQGIALRDGALDTTVRLRLSGDEGMHVGTRAVFSDLDLEEPEGGFLERVLSLPLALDSVLFLLRNASGEHRLSVDFGVDAGGVSTADLALAGTAAVAEVIASAVAGAPLRLLSSLVPEAEEKEEPRERLTLAFAPGATEVLDRDAETLETLAERLDAESRLVARLVHEVGGDDLARAEELANPSEADCLALTGELRRRRSALARRIDEDLLAARVLYAVGSEDAATASEELRALERELAGVESSLDQVLEVLRSASPRQRWKRTRRAARELAQARLDTVAAALRQGLTPRQAERVELRSVRVPEAPEGASSRVVLELFER